MPERQKPTSHLNQDQSSGSAAECGSGGGSSSSGEDSKKTGKRGGVDLETIWSVDPGFGLLIHFSKRPGCLRIMQFPVMRK